MMERPPLNQETLQILLEISRKFAEQRYLDPLLHYAMVAGLELFKAEYGYLILCEKDGAYEFRVRLDKHGNQLALPETQISYTILEKVFKTKEPIITANAILDAEFNTAQSVQHLQLQSVMCVPLITRGAVIGAIYVENRSEKALFEKKDLLLLQYFAAQAAISIENAVINEDLETRVTQRTSELNEAVKFLKNEISIRKKIETELRKLSSAVEQSPNSIVITNTQGEIEYVNPAFTNLTGYELEEIRGTNPRFQKSGLTPEDTYRELWATIQAGNVWRGEFINQKKNGEFYRELAVIAPIRNGGDEITHFVAIKEDVTSRKQAEDELKRLATIDPLTGILNRRHFFKLAEVLFEQARRYRRDLSALMIDADHFKQINDQYGHATGDQVLQILAQYLTHLLRKADLLGRYGGEEFVIVMPETSILQAYQAAERLLDFLNKNPIQTENARISLTLSIGVAAFDPETTPSIDRLVDQADQALYRAKDAGRNCVEVYQGITDFHAPVRLPV